MQCHVTTCVLVMSVRMFAFAHWQMSQSTWIDIVGDSSSDSLSEVFVGHYKLGTGVKKFHFRSFCFSSVLEFLSAGSSCISSAFCHLYIVFC